MKPTARNAAVSALCKWEQEQGYSNIVLDRLLSTGRLTEADSALATRLFYGVLEKKLTLDYLLTPYSRKPLEKLDTAVRNILRIAVYQLFFMDKIPSAAVVHQAVSQCREWGFSSASGFVNGVLRARLRDGIALPKEWPQGSLGLSVQYSCPQEWIELWQKQYGTQTALLYLQSLQQPPMQVLRVNTLATSVQQMTEKLQQQEIAYLLHPDLPHCLLLPQGASAKQLAKIPKDWYYYQDTASQWACVALDAQPNEKIADLCAAPGGKTLTLAQMMQGSGEIWAFDIHEHKCEILRERAQLYGAKTVRVSCRDAAAPIESKCREAFDRVLCDVPCSGLGVIRRKPEIRYKRPKDFEELPKQQLEILLRGAEMVRVGGVLQYSTCTLRAEENEQIIQRFLQLCPSFVPRQLPIKRCFEQAGLPQTHYVTLFPHLHGTDGFFVAGFIKERSV